MTDDRKPKRQRSHWGDDDRATVGASKRHTSVHGHPITIDSELTPPPQMAPMPPSDGSIPPPIAERLDLLADNLGQLTAAVGRVWDGRSDSARIDRLEAKIDAHNQTSTRSAAELNEFVLPAIKAITGRLESVWQHTERSRVESESFTSRDWPAVIKTLEQIEKSLEAFGARFDRLERQVERVVDQVGAHGSRLGAVEQVGAALDVRITALERHNREAVVARAATEQTEKKIFDRARMVLVAVGAVIGGLAANLPALIQWLRS